LIDIDSTLRFKVLQMLIMRYSGWTLDERAAAMQERGLLNNPRPPPDFEGLGRALKRTMSESVNRYTLPRYDASAYFVDHHPFLLRRTGSLPIG
jgi:hypothetical protein